MAAAANRPHAMATIMSPNATKLLRNGKANDSTSEAGTSKSIWPHPCQAHRKYVCKGPMRSKARTHGSGNARMHGLGPSCALGRMNALHGNAQIIDNISISGRVVQYIVAIDVTRARFPADACFSGCSPILRCKWGWGLPLGFTHASGEPIARQLYSAHGAIHKPRGQATSYTP